MKIEFAYVAFWEKLPERFTATEAAMVFQTKFPCEHCSARTTYSRVHVHLGRMMQNGLIRLIGLRPHLYEKVKGAKCKIPNQ